MLLSACRGEQESELQDQGLGIGGEPLNEQRQKNSTESTHPDVQGTGNRQPLAEGRSVPVKIAVRSGLNLICSTAQVLLAVTPRKGQGLRAG